MTQNVRWFARRGDIKRLFDADQHVQSVWTFESPIYIGEIAAAGVDIAAYGQLWVKNAVPNELWFTDDAGGDHQLTAPGSGYDHVLSLYISEAAAARANDPGYSQLWVLNAPSTGMPTGDASLWFKDAAGYQGAIVSDADPILGSLWTFGGAVSMLSAVRIGFSLADTSSGRLELEPRNTDPAIPAGSAYLYTKGSPTQLYFRSSDGTITQLTP